MEKTSNKEKPTNQLSPDGEQLRFQSKPSEEPLKGQEVLRDILSAENSAENSERQEEETQIPFEEFAKLSTENHSIPSIIPVITEESQIIPPPNSPAEKPLGEETPMVQEGEQIKFQSSDEAAGETPPSSSGVDNTSPETRSSTEGRTYEQSEWTSSIFLLKKGTRRAFVVLKDIFGDADTGEGEETYQNRPVSNKKKSLLLVLTLLLGIFGVHRLYLGQYTKILQYLLTGGFWWLSYEFLPDRGLSNLVAIFLGSWIVADTLAIIFSRRIFDGQGHILRDWI